MLIMENPEYILLLRVWTFYYLFILFRVKNQKRKKPEVIILSLETSYTIYHQYFYS